MPAPMRQLRTFIVIRNGSDMRLVNRRPNLAPNEVAVEVIINAPQPPRIVAAVTIDLPDPPPVTATVESIDYGDEDSYREANE